MSNSSLVQTDLELWYAIYTKYKCEKQVVKDLQSKGIHAYVPLLERVKRYTRKIKRYYVPLINCYVFVKISESERVKVLETENVMRFIKPGKKYIAIPEEEIEILRRIVGDAELEVESSEFMPVVGDDIEIVGGSLTGLHGKLVDSINKNTVVIGLENLGYQFQIKIDQKLIKKVVRR